MRRLTLPLLLASLALGPGACKQPDHTPGDSRPLGSASASAASAAASASGAPEDEAPLARMVSPDAFASTRGLRPVGTMHWSPDGKRLTVGTWLLSSDGKRLASLAGRSRGFSSDGATVAFELNPEDESARAGFDPGDDALDRTRLTLWSAGRPLDFPGTGWLAWSARAPTLLLRTRTELSAWSAVTQERKALPVNLSEKVFRQELSPDGGTLAHQLDPQNVQLIDLKTGQRRAQVEVRGAIRELRFSPDGSRLLIECDGEEQVLIHSADPTRRRLLKSSQNRSSSPAFSPSGQRLAVPSGGKLTIHTVAELSEPTVIDADVSGELIWSADERHLAWSSNRTGVTVVDLTTRAVRSVPGHRPRFHPQRPLLALERGDAVQVRAVPDLTLVAAVAGHQTPWQDSWTPEGLLMTLHDSVWSFWDAQTGALRERVPLLTSLTEGASRSWGGPSVTAGFVSFAQSQRDLRDGTLSESVRVVIRRRDGQRLYFRVVTVEGRHHTVASDESGRFFCDEEALAGFAVKTPRGERPAPRAREQLSPGLLGSFFGG